MDRLRLTVLVILGHVGLFGLLLLLSMLTSCQWFKPKPEETITIDLSRIPNPPDPTAEPATPQPTTAPTQSPLVTPTRRATARPTPTPTPTPRQTPRATPTPHPTSTPSPTATPRATPTPRPQPTPTPTWRARTPDEIRRDANVTPVSTPWRPVNIDLGQGLNTGGGRTHTGGGSAGGGGNLDGVENHGKALLRALWTQPVSISSGSGLSATVAITIRRDGNVQSARVVRPSGNLAFDQSIREALSGLSYIKALPQGFSGTTHTYEIVFNAE